MFQTLQDIYFIAQFFPGAKIPKSIDIQRLKLDTETRVFCGEVVLNLEDAAWIISDHEKAVKTWIVRPKNHDDGWEYVCTDGKFEAANNLSWKKCSQMTLEEINNLLYRTKAIGKSFNAVFNNSQHFAAELFDMVK